MKIHKLEIIVCDPNREDLDIDEVKTVLEQGSDYIFHFVKTKTKNYKKEWEDNSPFNFTAKKANNAFEKLK